MKWVIRLVVVLLVGGGGYWWYEHSTRTEKPSLKTAKVKRADLAATFSATGTIEPEEVVDVGAQVAGQILGFGADPRNTNKTIDYATPVEKGTILARIDESIYRAQVDRAKAMVDQAKAGIEQAQAQVASADANVDRAKADVGQYQAKLEQAERDWTRLRKLVGQVSVSDSELDAAESALKTSQAGLTVGKATVVQMQATLKDSQANVLKTKATLADAQAAYDNASINLGYCTIKSPVKGVIVDRRVNVGQTVVSSLNAPSLFLIAKDLKRLQVWASVNEADVGNIRSGQPVTFTVDAYPNRVFNGEVAPDQPRLNASMTQNVVTYTVVVNTDNSDGKLLPYLTANLKFEISKRAKALLVPNAALRWKPEADRVAADARDAFEKSQHKKPQGGADSEKEAHDRGTVWVEDGEFVRPVAVKIGLTDGLSTEITGGDLKENDEVVVGENRSNDGSKKNAPFAPKVFGGNKKE